MVYTLWWSPNVSHSLRLTSTPSTVTLELSRTWTRDTWHVMRPITGHGATGPVQTIAINQQTPVRGAQCCWNTNQSLAATWTQIKYLEKILEGCKILLSSRKISNFKLAPIFVIWLMLHKGKFGWKCLKVSCHVSRASLYIRYWSMAHTVGTCVLRSWPRPTWCYQWIINVDTNFECLSRYSIKLQMPSKEKR